MERLEIRGNVLVVNCDLNPYVAREFESCCDRLLALDSPELVVDFSRVREISSVFLASVVHTCVAAAGSSRRITLRVPRRLVSFFDFTEAEPGVTLQVVEPPPPRGAPDGG